MMDLINKSSNIQKKPTFSGIDGDVIHEEIEVEDQQDELFSESNFYQSW